LLEGITMADYLHKQLDLRQGHVFIGTHTARTRTKNAPDSVVVRTKPNRRAHGESKQRIEYAKVVWVVKALDRVV